MSKIILDKANETSKVVWTNECTIEEVYYDLVGVKIEATALEYFGGHKTFHYRKYVAQARELIKWIPINIKPQPFKINISDLSPEVQQHLEYEYKNSDEETFNYILRQAVGRIFESLAFRLYHRSIAKKLAVKLKK